MFKVNNENTRTTSLFGVFFFVHFKHFTPSSSVSIVYFERVNVSWVISDDKELAKMLTNFFKCS